MLSIQETAELLGMGKSTLSKKLQSFSVNGIMRENKRVWVPLSSIAELKKALNYNDEFDNGNYYSTAEVANKFNEGDLKIKRTDINNWIKKGKVRNILHMGYRYIHEDDLYPFIEQIKSERAIPEGYCTLNEASSILGIHRQTISLWAAKGDIESVQTILNRYRQTVVKKDSLKVVKRNKRKNMLENFAYVDIGKLSEKDESIKEKKNEADIDLLHIEDYLIVKDAAEHLGIKKNTLQTFLRNGKFPSAKKVKNKWYIPKEEILSYQEKKNTIFESQQLQKHKLIQEKNKQINYYRQQGYLTLLEVSERINLSKSRTSALLHKDAFPNAIKVHNKWFIPKDDIHSYYEFQSNLIQGYLTINEVAKELNISNSGVHALITRGKLRNVIKFGNARLIPESSLTEYKKQKENNQISLTKPDMINELNHVINSVHGKEHLKETMRLYSDFTMTKLNATNGRIYNVRRVFNHLKRIFYDIIINLEVEIYELNHEDIETVMTNSSYSNPIRELFLKFFKEALLIKGKKLDKEYVLSRKGEKADTDLDSEKYSPEVYYLFEQHVKDIEKHISLAIKSRQYANMWVLTTMLLTNAWRPSDIIFEMPHMDIEIIDVLEFDWFKKNRLSPEQCQLIVNQLYLKLNNAEVSKTNADLHFLVAPDMVKCLAYACVISELYCRELQDDDMVYEKERLLLGTFVSGVTENPTTSGTTTHKKFFKDDPELAPFSSKKLHNSTMTYLFLDISEDEDESELALEVIKWARSHEDINVTAGYIKLTNKDGTLNRVSINLFKRGHFGWLYNYMVQLAFSNTGFHQSFEERTKTIEDLKKEYTPIQIEAWAKTLLDYKNRKESVIKTLYKMNIEQLKEIVIKIYKGQMPSRDGCGQCMSYPDCHFANRKTCIGCINFIPQLQQVLIEAKEEFYRLIDSIKNCYTDAILKRDSVFLFNVLLLFNEAAETFGNDTVNGFLSSEERKNAIYGVADKLKLPTVNT